MIRDTCCKSIEMSALQSLHSADCAVSRAAIGGMTSSQRTPSRLVSPAAQNIHHEGRAGDQGSGQKESGSRLRAANLLHLLFHRTHTGCPYATRSARGMQFQSGSGPRAAILPQMLRQQLYPHMTQMTQIGSAAP